jgi:hypothetical protein
MAKTTGKTMILTSLMAAGLLAFAGCASTSETMMQKGYGPAYSKGYEDGCESGKKAGGGMFNDFRKDVSRYDREYKYREGWEDGYRQCKGEEKALMQSIQSSQRAEMEREAIANSRRY